MTQYNVVTRLFLDATNFEAGITKSQIAQERLAATISTTSAIADTAYASSAVASSLAADKVVAADARMEAANLNVAESAKGMGLTGLMAVLGVTIALDKMVKSAMETDAQISSMKVALKNLGMGKASQEFEHMANNNTAMGFTVNSTARSLQTLATLTHSASDAVRLNSLAMDEARAKHVDLATADSMVQMQLRGSARGFTQFGVTLDATLPRAKAITKAMNDVQKAVKGQAEDYLKTAAGKVDALKASFGQVADVIGRYVLPVVTNFLNLIQRFLPDIAIVVGFATAIYAVVKATRMAEAAMKALRAASPFEWYVIVIGAVITIVALLWNRFKVVRDIIVDILDVGLHVFGDLIKVIGWTAQKIVEWFTLPLRTLLKVAAAFHFPGAKAALNAINTGVTDIGKAADIAGNKINSFQVTLDKLRNAKLNNPFSNHTTKIDDTSAIHAKPLNPAAKAKNASKAIAAKYKADLKTLNTEIDNALKTLKNTRQKGSDAISAIIATSIGEPSELEKAFDATKSTATTVLVEFDKLHKAILDRMDGYANQDKQKILDNLAMQSSLMVDLVTQRDTLTKQMKVATDLQAGAVATMAKTLLDYGIAAGILQKTTNQTIIHVIQTTTGAIVTQGNDSLDALDTITNGLQNKLTAMTDFTTNIKNLQARGLDSDYLKQLINAGVDTSGTTVAALSKASDAQLKTINNTYGQITTLADSFANTTGAHLYNSGITNLTDYISGLKAQQSAVTNQMNTITATITAQMAAIVPLTANVGKDTATALLDNLAKYINDPKNQKAVLDNATALANQIKGILSSAMGYTPTPTSIPSQVPPGLINVISSADKAAANAAGNVHATVIIAKDAITVDAQGNATQDPSKITATINMSRTSHSRLIDL